jgi:hypothetical protein
MREIETNWRFAILRKKSGFPVRPVLKLQQRRWTHRILSQQLAQDPSRSHEVIPIAWEKEPARAKFFILRKNGCAPVKNFLVQI